MLVEGAVSLDGRHADLGLDQRDLHGDVRERPLEHIAHAAEQRGAALEEERDIRAEGLRDGDEASVVGGNPGDACELAQDRARIRRRAAQAGGARGEAGDRGTPAAAGGERALERVDRPVDDGLLGGDAQRGLEDRRGCVGALDGEPVAELEGDHDGICAVVAPLIAAGMDAQMEVDLRGGQQRGRVLVGGGRHGGH